MTPSMREVQRIVTRLANAGGEMPNNPVLGELAGGRGRSSVLRALRRLVSAGVLTVERQGSQRRCTVLASGKATGWGEARPGHSPYLHRRHGDTTKIVRPRVRRPESRPLPAQLPPAPEPAGPDARAALRLIEAPGSIARRTAGETCQFPLWADGERPGREPKFCCNPAAPGASFCDAHQGDCFRKRHTRPAAASSIRFRFDTAA